MLLGLYRAASALDAAAQNQDRVAQNLAHASTPGYRRQGLLFEILQGPSNGYRGSIADGSAGVFPAGEYTQFETGPVQHTGNPLDLALAGDAFFVLDGPGGPVYTRSGVFQRGANGELTNPSGLRVAGQGGPLTIPPEAAQISVSREGTVFADGVELGRLKLASFRDPSQLQRVGDTLFSGPPPTEPDLATVRVEQGYREGSNVQIVNEMVSMMLGMRHYESAQRAMRALSDALQQNTTPQS